MAGEGFRALRKFIYRLVRIGGAYRFRIDSFLPPLLINEFINIVKTYRVFDILGKLELRKRAINYLRSRFKLLVNKIRFDNRDLTS